MHLPCPALVLLLAISVASLPLPRHPKHDHVSQEDTSSTNSPLDLTLHGIPAVNIDTTDVTPRGALLSEISDATPTPNHVPTTPHKTPQSAEKRKKKPLTEWVPSDYPADTTGTIEEDFSTEEDEEEDYPHYPDLVSKDEEERDQEYFTDLRERYEDLEEGPSFQDLILFAASRHRHRGNRVPPSDVTILL